MHSLSKFLKNTIDLITVIITTFNRPKYLLYCLKSVLDQSYSNIEVIVVSDGENLENREIIKDFKDSRLAYYELPHSGLPAISRNFGIGKAVGDFIAFCDDDDCWVRNKLELQLEFILETNADLVHCDRELIDADSNIIQHKDSKIQLVRKFELFLINKKFYFFIKSYISLSSILVKAIVLKTNKFSETQEFRGTEDYYFLMKTIYDYKINFQHQKLLYYRVHDNNLSSNRLNAYLRSLKVIQQLKIEKKIEPIHFLIGHLAYSFKYSVQLLSNFIR